MNICIYGASSAELKKIYYEKTEELGQLMGKRGHGPCDIQRRGYGTGADRSSTYTRGEEHRAGRFQVQIGRAHV